MHHWAYAVLRTQDARDVRFRRLALTAIVSCLTALAPSVAGSVQRQRNNPSKSQTDNSSSPWIELADDWRLTSADTVSVDGGQVSSPDFDVSQWHLVRHMPATFLQALEDDGVDKDLYFGMNLASPGDLWQKDWWYRTTFTVPEGHEVYSLIFKGINYRAEIWLNSKKVAEDFVRRNLRARQDNDPISAARNPLSERKEGRCSSIAVEGELASVTSSC